MLKHFRSLSIIRRKWIAENLNIAVPNMQCEADHSFQNGSVLHLSVVTLQ